MSVTTNTPAAATGSRDDSLRDTPRQTSLLSSCLTLYQLSLRQHLHGKRWLALLLLFALPAGLATLVRLTDEGPPHVHLEFILAWILVPQALLPLAALLYASGIIQDEQEEQTITYLLIRPIPKWLLFTVKMLATWTTTVLLVIGLTVLTYAAIYVGTDADRIDVIERCLAACGILVLAVVAYCSLFGLISMLTKRTLVVGVLYTIVIEGMLAIFPLSLRMATIIYYVRVIAYRTMDFEVTWHDGRSEDVAAVLWSIDTATTPYLAEHPRLSTCVIVLVTVSIVCTAIASWLCSQREFHVKTPEKGA